MIGAAASPKLRSHAGFWHENGEKAGIALLLLSGLLLYAHTFTYLVTLWWTESEYSHGFLIPFISFYFAWSQRESLQRLPLRPSALWGGLGMAFSILILAASRAGGFDLLGGISLLLFIPSCILCVWGWAHLKLLAFPLLYLQFMVPWMEDGIDHIYHPLQMFASHIGTTLLGVIGIPALQNGTYIVLPNITLEVATACSGIRFLISVVALGLALVYVTQKTWPRATFVVATTAAIAIFVNGLRVAVCGLLGEKYGPDMIHGPKHILQGWFVAQIGIAILFLLNWWVAKWPSRNKVTLNNRPVVAEDLASGDSPSSRALTFSRTLYVCAALVTAASIFVEFYATPQPVSLNGSLASVPRVIASNWAGFDSNWIDGTTFFPGVDQQLTRAYREPSGREVDVYVAYFADQHQGKSLVSQFSRTLQQDTSSEALKIGLPGRKDEHVAKVQIGTQDYDVLFWYQYPALSTQNRYVAKFEQLADAFTHRRNNGAAVIVAMRATADNSDPAAMKDLFTVGDAFSQQVSNLLHRE